MKKSLKYLIGAMFLAMVPEMALAGNSELSTKLCTVITWFTGDVARGIAVLGVIFLGIGALFGKISWGMALMVTTGVVIIFGVVAVLSNLGYNTQGDCQNITTAP